TTTATTTPTTTGTTAQTSATTTPTTGGTTEIYGTGYTPSPTIPQFPSDEMTRKEKESGLELKSCDKGQKWKTYMEKTLESGPEGMVNDFRNIRGFLPPMATRMAFDAHPEKNRFEDIVCIDQTRVRLGCGSYIHASWVNITATRKAILTQLPNPESGAQFWQMVLDVDAQAILLLLTHAEFNMFHASGVFPAEQDFLHFDGSHVRVGEFKRVVIDRDWTMHVISVRSGDRRKYVHMHHYSGWTHGKQPVRLLDLWQIQSVFRKYQNPHIYMSLSGCGRAGTYAAFEIAHERLHSDSFQRLVITDCVCRARQGRMHAVQRAVQLQTIHAAIMEHIMSTRFCSQLPTKTTQKYEEFMDRFNKCAELQEDLQ
ncbi:Tyrosine-protein phosphatase domain-containing protein, partial [Trichostrongylus colubriformis]